VIERQALVSRQHWRELRRGEATLVPEPFGVLSVAAQSVVVRGVAPRQAWVSSGSAAVGFRRWGQ